MNTLDAKKLGTALGLTGVLFYFGCILVMMIGGQSGTIWFVNSLLHGLDVTSVVQANIPIGQTIAGIVLTFGLGWLTGFMTGTIYNWGKRSK